MELKINTYKISHKANKSKDYYLYTINDLFIFYNKSGFRNIKDIQEEINSKFYIQRYFISEVSNRVNGFLNMDKILIDIKNINYNPYYVYDLAAFFNSRAIPILQFSNHLITESTNIYTLSLYWNFSNRYSLEFEKKCVIHHNKDIEYIDTNNLLVINNHIELIRSYDMDKDKDKLIKYLIILFNLKRKEIPYANQ